MLVFTVVVGMGVLRLWYDHNLLHLQASGIESVELEQRLLGSREQDAYYAVSVADAPADVVARKERLLKLPLVKKVEEIASRIPPLQPAKQAAVARIQQRLASLPDRAPQLTVPQLSELGQLLGSLKALLTGPGGASGLSEQFDLLTAVFQQTSPAECYARVTDYQQRMAQELLDRLHMLAAAADPQPPQFKDFPAALTDRFVGKRGKHLLKVYCKGDVWDMATMEKFVADLRSVDPKVTGSPLLAFEGSRQMKRSYEQAALYALIIIVPVVFFDFRSLRHTLLALLPLGVGILLMFGLMGHLNVPLNPANMIVLPLILGIGIDAGVHVVHDYISQPNGQYRISASTASAVVINAVTNMAGFGSLMIASHRGLQSLGRVLTIGLSTCLFASLVMLPALLLCVSRHRSRKLAASSPAAEPPTVRRRVEPPHPASPPAPVAAGRPRADILMRQNSAAPRL